MAAIPYEVAQAGCDVLEFAETVKQWIGGLWEEVLKVIDSLPFICRTNNGISVCFVFEAYCADGVTINDIELVFSGSKSMDLRNLDTGKKWSVEIPGDLDPITMGTTISLLLCTIANAVCDED